MSDYPRLSERINPEYQPYPRVSENSISEVLEDRKPFSLDYCCAALRDLRDARAMIAEMSPAVAKLSFDLGQARAETAEMRAVFKKLHAVISRECNDMLLQVLGKHADEVAE